MWWATKVGRVIPDHRDIEGMVDVTAAARRFVDIAGMVEQLQVSRAAVAEIEGMVDVTAAARRFVDIAGMVEQLQVSRAAVAEIEGMVDVTAAARRFVDIAGMVEQLQVSRAAVAEIEGPVHAADSTDAVAPPLPPADQEDAPEGVLEVVDGGAADATEDLVRSL